MSQGEHNSLGILQLGGDGAKHIDMQNAFPCDSGRSLQLYS